MSEASGDEKSRLQNWLKILEEKLVEAKSPPKLASTAGNNKE